MWLIREIKWFLSVIFDSIRAWCMSIVNKISQNRMGYVRLNDPTEQDKKYLISTAWRDIDHELSKVVGKWQL